MLRKWLKWGAIIGVIAAGLQIVESVWTWLRPSPYRLEATLEYATFRQIPRLDEFGRQLNERLESQDVRRLLEDALPESISEDERQKAVALMQLRLANEFEKFAPRFVPSTTNSVFTFDIENNGTRALQAVSIGLDRATIASVEVAGQEPRVVNVTDPFSQPTRIDVGTLQPRQSARVVVWSIHLANRQEAERMTLTHDMGVGNVTVVVPAGTWGRIVDDYGGGIVIVVLFILYLWGLARDAKSAAKQSNTKATQPIELKGDGGKSESGSV